MDDTVELVAQFLVLKNQFCKNRAVNTAVRRNDAWAKRGMQFVSTDDTVPGYDRFLVDYANK